MVQADIDDVVNLFRTFNNATHGAAGRYDLRTLGTIKRCVEDALRFLHIVLSW